MIARERSGVTFHVPFEGEPIVRVLASTDGDQARLWEWLRHSGSLPRVAVLALSMFERLLDDEATP